MRQASYIRIVCVCAAAVALATAGLAWAQRCELDSRYDSGTMFDESYTLERGGELRIHVDDMDLELSRGEGDRVSVVVHVGARDDERAQEYFERLHFTVRDTGKRVTIETNPPRVNFSGFWDRYRHVRVHAHVTVPENADVDIETEDGDILGRGLATSDVSLKTSDGDVTIDDLTGAVVVLQTSDGDIQAETIKSDRLRVATSDGDVTVGDVSGEQISVSTSDGDVRADMLDGKSISVSSSDGDVLIGVKGEELEGRTSDGDLEVDLQSDMAVDLRAGDGDITLRATPSLRADLNLTAEHVQISGEVTIDGDVSSRRVVGKLNRGGPTVRARTGDGDIHLVLR